MTNRLRVQELMESDYCGQCRSPITVFALPLGNPMYIVRTAWCETCQRPRFGLDGCGRDVSEAANQLVDTLRRTFGAH